MAQMQKTYSDELDTIRNKLIQATNGQSEMEERISQLTKELQVSKESYESQINSLQADLHKSQQIENDLKV